MNQSFRNDLFVRAARGEETPGTPIWLMRQAGRTDPEYIRLKQQSGMTLYQLFRHPEMAARISLLPKRLGVDAIIFFQDILTPLAPMGAAFTFAPGPCLEHPIRTARDIATLHHYDPADKLSFVPETFRLIHQALDKELPVLGFAGAPLTLAVFLMEGRSFGNSADSALALLREEPGLAHSLLEKLTAQTIDYLKLQIESGVAAVQLFESAAFLLDPALYNEFALPCQQRIFDALKGTVPTILFAREWDDLESLGDSGADILSLPATVSIAHARKTLGAHRVVQGNLSNRLLAYGSLKAIEAAARACIRSGQHRGHIFNLNHGLLPNTPYGNIQHLVKVVHQSTVN